MAASLLGKIGQIAFAGSVAAGMMFAAGLAKLVGLLAVSSSKKGKESICLTITAIAWKTALLFSPWVQLVEHPSSNAWTDVIKGTSVKVEREKPDGADCVKTKFDRPLFILGNHTSFFDTLLFVVAAPSSIVRQVRTYMNSSLFKLPLLGTICRSAGHFPVYFASTEDGKFSLDTAKMVGIENDVDAHIMNGGWLCFYPEGQINKNPDKLMPLRYGGFKRALEFDAQLAAFISDGNPAIWPVKAAVGGFPGRVSYSVKLLTPNGTRAFAAELRKKAEAEGRKDIPADYVLLSEAVQVMMQEQHDECKSANAVRARSVKQY